MNGNENIVHVEAIEGLAIEINSHIKSLRPKNARQSLSQNQASEDMNDFQVGTLHDLRILFEGDQ